MEVVRLKEGIVISQRKYILNLLDETALLGCKPADTPMNSTMRLNRGEESTPIDKGRYQRLVGKLIYLSLTRPDCLFVSVVNQHMDNPTKDHLDAVNKILRYWKMTPGHDLLFRKSETCEVEIYTDASWLDNKPIEGQQLDTVLMFGESCYMEKQEIGCGFMQ